MNWFLYDIGLCREKVKFEKIAQQTYDTVIPN